MNDSTTQAIISRMDADIEVKRTALKTIEILNGLIEDEILTKAEKLFLLSEIESWAKAKETTVLTIKTKTRIL